MEKNIDEKYFVKKNQIKIFTAWNEFIKNIKRPLNKNLPIIWIDEFKQLNKDISDLKPWKQNYINKIRKLYKENKSFIDKWMEKHKVNEWTGWNRKLEWCAGVNNYDIKNSFIQLRQSGVRCRKPTMFPTLMASGPAPILFDEKNKIFRHLTPRECANIQNFPKTFKLNKCDRQTYKQFGNAVNVAVIKYVVDKIIKFVN